MACAVKTRTLIVGFLVVSSALTESILTLRGSWTATTGGQTFRGKWGAETSPRNPNGAQGYWTLVNGSGERVLQGTWSAKKTGSSWHGTWTARTAQGRSFSGTWDSDDAGSKSKTFTDMLTRSLEKEISGSWQSGQYSGNWRLNGAKDKNGRH